MKKLVGLVTPLVPLGILLLSNINDTNALITDTRVTDNKVAIVTSKANNSPASATIMITRTTAPHE